MSVNGVTSTASSYETSNVSNKTATAASSKATEAKTNSIDGTAAVYEASSKEKTEDTSSKKTYKQDPELVSKLKAEVEARTQQLQDIVNKLLTKQGQTFDIATGNNLKSFYEGLEVDAETKAQAQKDIEEDGYWGVKQTSERIFDFAMALSGGDPEKMEKMRDAFQKGFKQATKAWGDELPEISQKTYAAVNSLFDNYANSVNATEE